jgi:hypothetical protein
MSEIYVRFTREGGQTTTLPVEQLTDAERLDFFRGKGASEMMRWVNGLCACLKEAKEGLAARRQTEPEG